jgi:isopenicillin N synthase-like dioxygenase
MDLPIINLELFLNNPNSEESLAECAKLAESLIKYGAIAVKDPRVPMNLNSEFIDQMEKYYEQPEEVLTKDVKPEVGYRVGLTPPSQESPRCKADPHCFEVIDAIEEGSRPLVIEGPDPKLRYGWMITPKEPKDGDLELLKAQANVPEGFPKWESLMNGWGGAMVQAVFTLSKMLGKGFNMDEDTFYSMIKEGSHLLSPTGSDLSKYDQVNTILAGNFIENICIEYLILNCA